jgi:ABC-type glycerol-3-phosphate transport system permease component
LLIYALIVATSICFLIPLAWLVSSALKPSSEIFSYPQVWFPHPIEWDNFAKALTALPFLRFALNTFVIASLVTIGNVFSSAIVAYGFARFKFPGKNVLFIVMLATLMIPAQIVLVPQFILFHDLGWVNTFAPLIVPAYFGSAFYIFLIRQFFMGIPSELRDAAYIDGAGEWRIFTRIYLPLSKPVLAAVAIFSFQGAWNDFLNPLIYLNNPKLFTLQLGLTEFQGIFHSDWNYIMAASAVIMIPMIIIFFIGQRYFIQGILMTGSKG